MADTLRIGILGAGFMGQTHGKCLLRLPGVSVAAVCDADAARAAALAKALTPAVPQVFADFNAMLAAAKLDALYVCLPPFAHSGQVEQAAAAGVHLFLEKPIALNEKRAEAMVAAIERRGLVSQVGFHMRFRTGVRRLKAMIADGSAGRPTLLAGRYWCNMEGGAWWRDRSKSGGQVYEQVIHLYDLALHLLGEPAAASGVMDNLCHSSAKDYRIEDTSVGTVRFASGAMATIAGSNCALPGHFIGDWRVVCEKALLDYRCTGQHWVVPDESTLFVHGDKEVVREDRKEDGDAYLMESEDFVAAIRGNGATLTPARHGLEAVRLVSKVIESAGKDGKFISLSPRKKKR